MMKINRLGISLWYSSLFISVVQLEETFSNSSVIVENLFRRTRNTHKQKMHCTLPQYPDNGQWFVLNGKGKPGEQIGTNRILLFQCIEGYKLSFPSAACKTDGTWSKLPECQRLCEPVYETPSRIPRCTNEFGKLINCDEATDGTYLTFECGPFYEMVGRGQSLICRDGLWSADPQAVVCEPVCGKLVENDAVKPIYGGKIEKEIKYPWVAAIYRKENNEFQNRCGGTLLSRQIVLTAAHCVCNEYGNPYPKEMYQVAVGKLYNKYGDSRDPYAQYFELSRIRSHKRFRGNGGHNEADIALLFTKKLVNLNNVVQPACFRNLHHINLHPASTGVVAGWGIADDGSTSDVLRSLEIPYKTERTCAQELPRDWADKYFTDDKICAGILNQRMSVCSGDSGGGLVYKDKVEGRYYIHGIVSITPRRDFTCDFQQNTLYTKVVSYYSFVDVLLNDHHQTECQLPSYPLNGKWIIEMKSRRKKPGQFTALDTVLKFDCDEGFELSSNSPYIECGSSLDMPTCQSTTGGETTSISVDNVCGLIGEQCKFSKDFQGKCSPKENCPEARRSPEIYGTPKGTSKTIVCCKEEVTVLQTTPPPITMLSSSTTETLKQTITTVSPPGEKPGEVSRAKCREYGIYAKKMRDNSSTTPSTESDVCPIETIKAISGIHLVKDKEFPHLGKLGYKDGGTAKWVCDGSLISENFMVIAARCSLILTKRSSIIEARLGVINQNDTSHEQIVGVSKLINFPEYSSTYHDIGLAKLEKSVKLSPYVRPACLQTETIISTEHAVIAGWRFLTAYDPEENTYVEKTYFKFYTVEECSKTYENDIKSGTFGNGIKEDVMICAGSSTDSDATCVGLIGNPLLVNHNMEDVPCMYDIIGISSYSKICGSTTNVPTIYTRIAAYTKWIEDIVWPKIEAD